MKSVQMYVIIVNAMMVISRITTVNVFLLMNVVQNKMLEKKNGIKYLLLDKNLKRKIQERH